MTSMVKIILQEVAEIIISVVKFYWHILILEVMVTIRRSFSAVKNVVATVIDYVLSLF